MALCHRSSRWFARFDSVAVKNLQRRGVITAVAVETPFDGQSKVEHSFDPSAVNRIVVHACYGDDVVTIQDQVDIDAFISGGSGNDVLTGGGGRDEMLGDAGNDILIGGSGGDVLDGGAGRNILIGGSTVFDEDAAALERSWMNGCPIARMMTASTICVQARAPS